MEKSDFSSVFPFENVLEVEGPLSRDESQKSSQNQSVVLTRYALLRYLCHSIGILVNFTMGVWLIAMPCLSFVVVVIVIGAKRLSRDAIFSKLLNA